jgi:drug/metabolite transporter (DMT)-like permease
MTENKYFSTYLGLTAVSFLWGTSFAAAKIGLRELAPLNLVIFRFLFASAIFAVILLCRREKGTVAKRDVPQFVLLGFLTITSYFYIQYTGLVYTTTINAALIVATSPVWTAFFGAVLGWEKLQTASLAGIGVAFAGVSLVITGGRPAELFASATLPGDLALLVNAVVWAGITVYGKALLQKYRPFVAMAWIHIFGTLLLVPFAVFPSPFVAAPLVTQLAAITWPTVASALYLAVLCSVFAYFMWYSGVERLGAVRTSTFTYFNPLFATITGVLLLGEPLMPMVVAGGGLIIAGVYLTNKLARSREEAKA